MTLQPAPFTDAEIDALVETVYAKVQQHHRLGPVVLKTVGDGGWPEHLATLKRFWAGILQGAGGDRGSPMAFGQRAEGLTEGPFTLWLGPFHAIGAERFGVSRAALAGAGAERIASSLKRSLPVQVGAAA